MWVNLFAVPLTLCEIGRTYFGQIPWNGLLFTFGLYECWASGADNLSEASAFPAQALAMNVLLNDDRRLPHLDLARMSELYLSDNPAREPWLARAQPIPGLALLKKARVRPERFASLAHLYGFTSAIRSSIAFDDMPLDSGSGHDDPTGKDDEIRSDGEGRGRLGIVMFHGLGESKPDRAS